MIDSNAPSSHAQYNEDLVLKALLYSVKKGTYVDVGANHPDDDSVTKLFYEQGWTGVNVEPIKKQYELFEKRRSRDTNLCLGISDKRSELLFREYTGISGHSTFSKNYMEEEPAELEYNEYKVKVITLNDLFDKYIKTKKVDFLKIDVEGLEYEVVKSNNWKKNRPTVICIESNHQEKDKDWDAILSAAEYTRFIFDGLNAYYIAEEELKITEGYAERIVQLNHDALSEYQKQAWITDSKQLQSLQKENNELAHQVRFLQEKLHETSPWNQPLRRRIKIALKGLTVDWIRYKRGH